MENKFIVDCKQKADLFISFFSRQCRPVQNDSTLPILTPITEASIDILPLTSAADILSLIRKLNINKSSGPDGISPRMLKLCDESVVLPLQIIFNNILHTTAYPYLWKIANVTPVFKKKDKQLISNYRPISLLPICSKIFEKLIFKNLYNYLISNNLITKNQSGFRPGDSTTNQLIDLVHQIHKSFDDDNCLEVRAVFLDISKTFDKVWHDGLIFKLQQNGVSGMFLSLLKSYLSNRQQRVVLNGKTSDDALIESGVPQGSVLGPLLFLVYINDLEKNIKSRVRFFADDTMLYSIVYNPLVTSEELNHDLECIRKWAYQWKMEFNPDPTKQAHEVLFSRKLSSPPHPPLFFNNTEVSVVKEQTHLGLILDNKLSFVNHIMVKIKTSPLSNTFPDICP